LDEDTIILGTLKNEFFWGEEEFGFLREKDNSLFGETYFIQDRLRGDIATIILTKYAPLR